MFSVEEIFVLNQVLIIKLQMLLTELCVISMYKLVQQRMVE